MPSCPPSTAGKRRNFLAQRQPQYLLLVRLLHPAQKPEQLPVPPRVQPPAAPLSFALPSTPCRYRGKDPLPGGNPLYPVHLMG